ncbi:hypothetical protein ACRJ4W_20665 [Streptomyces sp. GLT-R25]
MARSTGPSAAGAPDASKTTVHVLGQLVAGGQVARLVGAHGTGDGEGRRGQIGGDDPARPAIPGGGDD